MDEKITIIEGPPPIFEHVNDGWAMGLNESPTLSIPALTRLRTFIAAAHDVMGVVREFMLPNPDAK